MGRQSRVREKTLQASAPASDTASPAPAGIGRFASRYSGDLLAILLTLPVCIVVLQPEWFFAHDNMHMVRLFEQDVMIRAGQFPVRWYPDVAGGYGSPHPLYYAPLFYIMAQGFHALGLSLIAALKVTIITVIAATSVAMYRLARTFFGEGAGLVGAALYTYAPYHLLDLFVRGALSELIVFALFPLVFLAFFKLTWGTTPGRIAAAAAALGGLCLSHTITVMLVPPLVGGFILLLAWRIRFRRSFLAAATAAGLLGVTLSAFFLIPLVVEKDAVYTEIYAAGYFDYKKHFVEPFQLLFSPWGHGMSREGAADDGVSFRLGLIQLLGCVLSILAWKKLTRAYPGAFWPMTFWVALSAGGIFMVLKISSPVWSLVPPLRFVQFPWRFLMLPAIGMPLVAAAAVALAWTKARTMAPRLPEPPHQMDRPLRLPTPHDPVPRIAAAALCIGIVLAGAGMLGFRKRIPMERIGFGGDHTDMRLRPAEEAAASPTVFSRDFLRRETLHWFDHLPRGGYPYPPRSALDRPKAEIIQGDARLELTHQSPDRYTMKVEAKGPALLRLGVYSFPGWEWRVDGARRAGSRPPGRRPLMSVEILPGDKIVEASFRRTPARWAGDTLSIAALVILAMISLMALRKRSVPIGSAGFSEK
jgi:hypothetical protein